MDQIATPIANNAVARRQGVYWFGTLPDATWVPQLLPGLAYIRGQFERGEGGLEHWQLSMVFHQKASLATVRTLFAPFIGHWELTRSAAADAYVWKEDTRIGDPFELGQRPFKRNSAVDWERIRADAQAGRLQDIPGDVYVRYYGNLCRIRGDSLQPVAMERHASVFWGKTGTGKSHRAWRLAGNTAYSKDPRTKFWCGKDLLT